ARAVPCLGTARAAIAGLLAFGTAHFGADTLQAASWAAGAAAIGLTVAFVTILVPAIRDTRTTTVQQARAVVGSVSRPLWMRLYADVALLAGAGLVYWQPWRSGYQVV